MRDLRPHQTRAIAQLRDALRSGSKRPMLMAPTGAGKCLGRGTPVLLFDGRVKAVEDLVVGDLLMGPDSTPRRVLSVCSGREPLYRVTPKRGEPYVVNESHILSLRYTKGAQANTRNPGRDGGTRDDAVVNIGVLDYLASSRTFQHIAKGWRTGVDFSPHEAEPPIDPYFLGLWLGDGSSRHPTICNGDPETKAFVREFAEHLGMRVRIEPNSARSENLFIVSDRGVGNPLKEALRACDLLQNKHVPLRYATGNREERLALLAGVMDSDGHWSGKGFELTLKNERLLDGIIFVARSLGFAAYKRHARKTCTTSGTAGDYWRCHLNGPVEEIPCRVKRKQAPPRTQKKNPLRVGITVEPIGEGDYFGFEIDGDRLFLLGDFTVTHNTVLAASIIDMARAKGRRVIFTVPAVSLVDQTAREFFAEGVRDIGVMQADHPMTDASKPVQIASIQTLQRRTVPEADLVIIDEAHRMFAFIEAWMTRDDWAAVPFIGLSATPWTKGLGRLYDRMIVAATTAELIDRGFLSGFRVFAPSHPDLTGVRTVAGDFHEGDLARAMNERTLVADVVATWLAKGEGRPTLCFAVDRLHAKTLQAQFEAAGVSCGYVDATTPRDERERVRKAFASGEYRVVCNVGVLTTGVDWDVRCIILARPTKSEMLYVQMIGRALRTAPGKDHALILDHSDTTLRLGFVTDIHHHRLDDGRIAKDAAGPQERESPKPKECPKCHYVRAPRVATCPACGYVPERATEVETVDGELVDLTAQRKANREDWADKVAFMAQLKTYAAQKGKSEGWVAHRYRAKTGVWPNDPRVRYCAPAASVSPEVRAWLTGQAIRYAKGRAKAAGRAA